MLVMTLLIIVLSVAAPSLGNFFRGRTLDSEARRLLALTRHGQSRAVFEGVPMLLWLDTKGRTYGLEEEPGYSDLRSRSVEFMLDKDLQMEVVNSEVNPTARPVSLGANRRNLPEIRFLPDGSISETSPQAVRLADRDSVAVWLTLSRNRLNYEIRNSTNEWSSGYP